MGSFAIPFRLSFRATHESASRSAFQEWVRFAILYFCSAFFVCNGRGSTCPIGFMLIHLIVCLPLCIILVHFENISDGVTDPISFWTIILFRFDRTIFLVPNPMTFLTTCFVLPLVLDLPRSIITDVVSVRDPVGP